jgi:hypothetical protein
MSATSTAGRGTGRASAGHLPQKVERARVTWPIVLMATRV